MERKWMIRTAAYEGLRKNAVNMVSAAVCDLTETTVPVVLPGDEDRFPMESYQSIWLCLKDEYIPAVDLEVADAPQSYGILVAADPEDGEKQTVVICGADASGLMYGCADFCNRYLGAEVMGKQDIWGRGRLERPMGRQLPLWKTSCTPAIKKRGIWTWGHMIFDYRGFFANMARLRLNQIVIWNDHPPVNAADVVRCAHEYGIEVIWGFSWGWSQPQYMKPMLENFDAGARQLLIDRVLTTYEQDYAHIPGDGIYFQSFTELECETVAGRCIAQMVVELVNEIGGILLAKYPQLQVQFGLHALSVHGQLPHIAQTDARIRIVWEDCGSFPYNYRCDTVTGFEETFAFQEKLLTLRGEREAFGAVLKGMTKLDWWHFSHFVGCYVMGERSESFISKRRVEKNAIWKLVQAGWLKNAEYVGKIIHAISQGNPDSVVQALVEDGMLERDIMLPVALYAQMLWEPAADARQLLQDTAYWPCVTFAHS